MASRAKGSFEVQLKPQTPAEGSPIGRIALEKQFRGDLDGASRGEMLTVATTVKESGVYVAIERVTGTLGGRRGTFALHHTGIMTRGAPQLTITVVPDSGTEELGGLTGTMAIEITPDGKHFYDFEYQLPG